MTPRQWAVVALISGTTGAVCSGLVASLHLGGPDPRYVEQVCTAASGHLYRPPGSSLTICVDEQGRIIEPAH